MKELIEAGRRGVDLAPMVRMIRLENLAERRLGIELDPFFGAIEAGLEPQSKGERWKNALIAFAGIPGAMAPAQVTGATGGVFQNSVTADGQFNLNVPGSAKLEGVEFMVRASGWVKFPAGTYTATIIANLYGVAGSAAWTAASGNKMASSTSLSITMSGTTALVVPFLIEMDLEGDSMSGLLQGLQWALVDNVTNSTPLAVVANAPTGVSFQTGSTGGASSGQASVEPVLQFAAGVTLTNAQTGAIANLSLLAAYTDD